MMQTQFKIAKVTKATALVAGFCILAACAGPHFREARNNWASVLAEVPEWTPVALGSGSIEVCEHSSREFVVVRPTRGEVMVTGNQINAAVTSVTGCEGQFDPGILALISLSFDGDTPFPLSSRTRVDQSCG